MILGAFPRVLGIGVYFQYFRKIVPDIYCDYLYKNILWKDEKMFWWNLVYCSMCYNDTRIKQSTIIYIKKDTWKKKTFIYEKKYFVSCTLDSLSDKITGNKIRIKNNNVKNDYIPNR